MYMQAGEFDAGELNPATDLGGINAWLKMNGLSAATASDSNVLGFIGGTVYEKEIDGVTYTFEEFCKDGEDHPTMVFVEVEGQPHWTSYSYPNLAWNFLKEYSIVNGKRIYTKGGQAAGRFSDVSADASYAQDVAIVTKDGLMNSVGNGLFAPNETVTRAQAITVLARLAKAEWVVTNTYTDVSADKWYAGYVGWATENGYVNGVGGGQFKPDRKITGEELDLMFTRYAESKGLDSNQVLISHNGPTVTRWEMAHQLAALLNAPSVSWLQGRLFQAGGRPL